MKKGSKLVKKSDKKKPVSIAISDNEKRILKRKAKENGISVSKYVSYMLKGV